MIKKSLFASLILCLTLTASVQAQEVKTIILKDGTQIKGQIMGIDKGRYVIHNPTLGEILIKENTIANIVMSGTPSAGAVPVQQPPASFPPTGFDASGRMQRIQSQIMSDPALMADIQRLAADPEIVSLIGNPAFMQAAQSGNMQALQNSPQVMQMMLNPKVQTLIQKLQTGQQ